MLEAVPLTPPFDAPPSLTLKKHLTALGILDGETMRSFRAGSSIMLALLGASMTEIAQHVDGRAHKQRSIMRKLIKYSNLPALHPSCRKAYLQALLTTLYLHQLLVWAPQLKLELSSKALNPRFSDTSLYLFLLVIFVVAIYCNDLSRSLNTLWFSEIWRGLLNRKLLLSCQARFILGETHSEHGCLELEIACYSPILTIPTLRVLCGKDTAVNILLFTVVSLSTIGLSTGE